MSLDALVSGRLIGQPVSRTARNGSLFATCKLRAADGKGESVTVSVITFSRSTVEALMALQDGDSVALSGELSISTYTRLLSPQMLDVAARQICNMAADYCQNRTAERLFKAGQLYAPGRGYSTLPENGPSPTKEAV